MAFTGVANARRMAPRRTWVAAVALAALVGHRLCRTTVKQQTRTPVLAFLPPVAEALGPRQAADKFRQGRGGGSARVTLDAQAPGQTERQAATEGTEGRASSKVRLQAQAQTVFQVTDAAYNPEWLNVEEKTWETLEWAHDQTFWAGLATGVFTFDMLRILLLIPPTTVEVVAVGFIYFGLYASRYNEVPKLDPHYQVSFYASLGWTFYAWASLVHGMAYGPTPLLPVGLAESLHTAACGVYLMSCAYFYSYHWGRHIKHVIEGRFRPWFAAGLASLTAVHGLTVGHILKVLDDPGWWGTVVKIYPGEWQWLADTRLLELYLTAAALFLVILHLRGVLTGTKNAAIVFLGTVILPTAALMLETWSINACAWEHYFMVGPKYF